MCFNSSNHIPKIELVDIKFGGKKKCANLLNGNKEKAKESYHIIAFIYRKCNLDTPPHPTFHALPEKRSLSKAKGVHFWHLSFQKGVSENFKGWFSVRGALTSEPHPAAACTRLFGICLIGGCGPALCCPSTHAGLPVRRDYLR